MAERRLLIADSNEDIRSALAQELQCYPNTRICGTGTEALTMIRQEPPDILVLDLMLPVVDGLTVLETIRSEGIRPLVLVVSSYISEYVQYAAFQLGIASLLLKPVSLSAVLSRIRSMDQFLDYDIPTRAPQDILDILLIPLGIPPEDRYYARLKDTLVNFSKDLSQHLGKEVYPPICKAHNISADALDSGLHRLITQGWKNGSRDIWLHLFPDATTKPPCNRVFLKKLAANLKDCQE